MKRKRVRLWFVLVLLALATHLVMGSWANDGIHVEYDDSTDAIFDVPGLPQ